MKENYPLAVFKAAQKIRLVLLDVDGVLTDGKLYYGNSGEELKAFDYEGYTFDPNLSKDKPFTFTRKQ